MVRWRRVARLCKAQMGFFVCRAIDWSQRIGRSSPSEKVNLENTLHSATLCDPRPETFPLSDVPRLAR